MPRRGVNFLDQYVNSIQRVTKQQVDQAIRKYFDLGHSVTVLCGTVEQK
jgi:predicted Zn-dependent peptidase